MQVFCWYMGELGGKNSWRKTHFWEEKTQSTVKVLKTTPTKKWRLKIETATKSQECFTVCRYNTDQPKNIEISASISSEVWLFYCETGMILHNPHFLAWLYLNARIRISQSMRKQVQLLDFFKQTFLQVLRT